MKVIEKTFKEGYRYAYSNVDPEYLNFEKGIRVLPAAYFHEPKISFTLIARYEPGENQFYPEGGFEVYGPNNEVRSFFIDQVIVHPYALKKRMPRSSRGSEEEFVAKPAYVPTGGARGRKPLDPAEKARREAEKAAKPIGTGKRGRPKKEGSEGIKVYVPTGGKRGRPAMDPALKKSKPYVKTGGKRGRPAKTK